MEPDIEPSQNFAPLRFLQTVEDINSRFNVKTCSLLAFSLKFIFIFKPLIFSASISAIGHRQGAADTPHIPAKSANSCCGHTPMRGPDIKLCPQSCLSHFTLVGLKRVSWDHG